MTRLKRAEKLLREIYDELGPKESGPLRPAEIKEFIKNSGRWDFPNVSLMKKIAMFLNR